MTERNDGGLSRWLGAWGRAVRGAGLALATGSGLGACAGAGGQPAPEVATVPTEAPAESDASSPDLSLQLEPAQAPRNIVGQGRLRNPRKTLDTLVAWAEVSGLDWRSLLEAGAGPAAPLVPVLDFDAPVDLVATLDEQSKNRPRVLFAIAVGLTSRQGALDALSSRELSVEFVEPGVHSVVPAPGTICFVSAALGPSPARLACSESREALIELNPYLTRGTPATSRPDADLQLEVLAEPAWRMFGDKAPYLRALLPMVLAELETQDPALDAEVRDAATTLTDELIRTLAELDRAGLSLTWNEEGESLDARLEVKLRGHESWLSSALLASSKSVRLTPERFWQLPGDLDQGAWSVSEGDHKEALIRRVAGLARVTLRHFGASQGAAEQWAAALELEGARRGTTITAHREIPQSMRGDRGKVADRVRDSQGYGFSIVEEDAEDATTKLLEASIALYEDADLRKALAVRFPELGIERLPKVDERKGGGELSGSTIYRTQLPLELVGSLLDSHNSSEWKGQTLDYSIIRARRGKDTWVGWSAHRRALEAGLLSALSPKPSSPRLTERPGLASLKTNAASMGLFLTLRSLASSLSALDPELESTTESLPPQLLHTPIVMRSEPSPEGPAASLVVEIPRSLIRSAAQLGQAGNLSSEQTTR